MTVSNMSIEWGARAGLIAADETTFQFLEGRPGVQEPLEQAIERWSHYTTDADATFDRELVIDASALAPQITWGTNPGQTAPITAAVPAPANEDEQRALDYMGLKAGAPLAGTPVDRVFIGSCTNGRLGDLRAAAEVVRGKRVAAGVQALVVPGSMRVKARGRGRGPRPRLRRCRLRVAQRRVLDVPRHESRRRRAGGARGLDVQPQLRGPPGPPRAHPPDEPRDGRRGCRQRLPGRRAGARLMEHFDVVTGPVAALDRANVDTDQIIPKQFLKRIERTGYGQFLFWDWAKDDDFPLNRPEFERAPILVAGDNFGCGSSREHAAWALAGRGFRAILAPSFADIFRSNCGKNGLLTVELPEADVRELMEAAPADRHGRPGAPRRHAAIGPRGRVRGRRGRPLPPAERLRRHRPDDAARGRDRRLRARARAPRAVDARPVESCRASCRGRRPDEDPRRGARGVRQRRSSSRTSSSRAPRRARCSCASRPAASATPTSTRPAAPTRRATRRACSGTRARASSRTSARASRACARAIA